MNRHGMRLLVLLCCALTAHADEPTKPNIIVVMSDDQGQWATGTYNPESAATPTLDWLADHGVLFANATSPAPVCSPARASFYTGKMPSQHGVHDFLRDHRAYDAGWLAGETLLQERMQNEGYRTALFGKWHATVVGREPQRGFDRWLSYDALGPAGWQNQYQHSGEVFFSSDGERVRYADIQAWYLTQNAIDFIDEIGDEPFFINLNFVEPHGPMAGLPERLVDRYRGRSGQLVPAGDSSVLVESAEYALTPDDHDEQLAQYLAAISLLDDQVGRLLDALQGRDLMDNTIIVFTSDHGLLVGQYGLYGKTNATRPPNFYEETIRIPMVISGPERYVRRGQVRSEFVDLLDLHTTILDLASNGRTSSVDYGPGLSLRPLLQGERRSDWPELQFAERGQLRMVTDGRWKLVREYRREPASPPADVWFDLAHPLGERHASDGVPDAVREKLASALESFFATFETPEHTGRDIWNQSPPNPLVCRDLGIACPDE